VITDDLSAPLGQDKPRSKRWFAIRLPQALAGLLGLALAVFAGWVILVDEPFGGEPLAVLHTPVAGSPSHTSDNPDLRVTKLTPDERPNSPDITIKAAPVVAPPSRTITIIDGTSGKRQEVQIPADDRPDLSEGHRGSDPRLTESTRRAPAPRTRDR
jgi:hypothetical protein